MSNKWAVSGGRAQNTRAGFVEAGERLNCEAPALPTTCRDCGLHHFLVASVVGFEKLRGSCLRLWFLNNSRFI